MSVRSRSLWWPLALAGLLLWTALVPVSAQVAAGASPGLNTALVRLFGGITAFTAQLEIRMLDEKGEETLNAPLKFRLLDGKMRGDVDVARLKSKELPALAAAAAQSVGMDRVVTLVRPDKKESYLLYPAFKACVVAPLGDDDLAVLQRPAKIERTPLGQEKLDGHHCVKTKVVLTAPDGQRFEATTWNAADLKDFPLQIETHDGTNRVILHFWRVKFERAEPALFDLPAGTEKFDDARALSQAVMKKLIGQALGK
ncbi:MAG TPA: hypothetical protein VFV96_17375 [Verrucomicrobiae bacterium]|nr:hypothetical protein [Verrucomicrobiae bacterium]